MNYFCTLFDSFYLSRGLIMYNSLRRCSQEFHLYIFAFDDTSFNILNSMKLHHLTVISLNEFENEELRRVKKERTKAEYCWTCTPSTISYVLERYKVPECTYIDADLYFFNDPAVLVNEMYENGKNVLISEHRYSIIPKLYEQERAGRFCVQFMTFVNQESSLDILEKWRTQCIDWCYARHEDGKFGDQKYLDEWPLKYSNVRILQHKGGGLAPWNINNYKIYCNSNSFYLEDKSSHQRFDPVFYHYQYVKSLDKEFYDIGWYYMNSTVKKSFYRTYLSEIEKTESMLSQSSSGYFRIYSDMKSYLSGNPVKLFLKRFLKYNIMKANSNGISD
jgi:hypothetical protein